VPDFPCCDRVCGAVRLLGKRVGPCLFSVRAPRTSRKGRTGRNVARSWEATIILEQHNSYIQVARCRCVPAASRPAWGWAINRAPSRLGAHCRALAAGFGTCCRKRLPDSVPCPTAGGRRPPTCPQSPHMPKIVVRSTPARSPGPAHHTTVSCRPTGRNPRPPPAVSPSPVAEFALPVAEFALPVAEFADPVAELALA